MISHTKMLCVRVYGERCIARWWQTEHERLKLKVDECCLNFENFLNTLPTEWNETKENISNKNHKRPNWFVDFYPKNCVKNGMVHIVNRNWPWQQFWNQWKKKHLSTHTHAHTLSFSFSKFTEIRTRIHARRCGHMQRCMYISCMSSRGAHDQHHSWSTLSIVYNLCIAQIHAHTIIHLILP